jgi:hypothetical protein
MMMTDVVELKMSRDVAICLREKLDTFAGKKIPDNAKSEIREFIERHRKKIFKGADFRPTMKELLREFRLQQLKEILQEG